MELSEGGIGGFDRFGDVEEGSGEDVVGREEGTGEGHDGEFGGFGAFLDDSSGKGLKLGSVV